MPNAYIKGIAGAAVAAGLGALAACAPAAPAEAPAPPVAYQDEPAPDLAGGPITPAPAPGRVERVDVGPTPKQREWLTRSGWAPAPRDVLIIRKRDDGVTVVTMQPVPNPPPRGLITRRREDGVTVVSMRPVPNPARAAVRGAARPTASTLVQTPSRPRPAGTLAPARRDAAVRTPEQRTLLVLAALQPTAVTPAAQAQEVMSNLSAALAPEMTKGRLQTAAAAPGQPAKVTLTLPPTLLGSLQGEAAKLGLGLPARRVAVAATLEGAGYEITPNGPQTASLVLGKPLVFEWQAAPGAQAAGRVTAQLSAELNGEGASRRLTLGALSADLATPGAAAAAAPAPAPAKAAAGGGIKLPKVELPDLRSIKVPGADKLKLPDFGDIRLPDLRAFKLEALRIPGRQTIDVPGLGPVASEKLVTAAILALVALLLIAIARNARSRRSKAARRRRFRTYETTNFNEFDPPPADR